MVTTTRRANSDTQSNASGGSRLDQSETSKFTEDAIVTAKREGLLLAVRARWVALAVIAVLILFLNPNWEALYYIVLLGLFALIGWAQLKVGKTGLSRAELALLFCDLALMTVIAVVPNPLRSADLPVAMQYRFDIFMYFYVFLAAGTLAYNWRTVVAMGTWTAGLWILGILWIATYPDTRLGLPGQQFAASGPDDRIAALLDPALLDLGLRAQELVIFLIVTVTLAITVRRSNDLVASHAAVVRERANLARYFSPNVVEELSHNDEPLKQVRTQDIAVLFVDIVGFTKFANGRTPTEVITTLRQFHAAMEAQVFKHHGTLDKYLGDGLMATFGTPFTGENDAGNALKCSYAMIAAVEALNESRKQSGQPPIRASFGLHYGPAVLGDIGANRLEFAVIGNTVNVASRLEALTRSLGTELVASDDIVQKARQQAIDLHAEFRDLVEQPAQPIRGLDEALVLWKRAPGGR